MPTPRVRSSFGNASAIAAFTTLPLIFAVPPIVPPSPGLVGAEGRQSVILAAVATLAVAQTIVAMAPVGLVPVIVAVGAGVTR
jgi:hypothetical protein